MWGIRGRVQGFCSSQVITMLHNVNTELEKKLTPTQGVHMKEDLSTIWKSLSMIMQVYGQNQLQRMAAI